MSNVCVLCGGSLESELIVHDRPDRFELAAGVSAAGYRRAWLECQICGSAMNLHPAGGLEKLRAYSASYYEVDLGAGGIAEKFAKVMAMPPERSDNAGRVSRILGFLRRHGLNESGRALDIGAGTGVFLARFLAEAGVDWAATAIEPDPDAATHLRSLGRFAVVQDLFRGQPEHTGFDLITLNKVLEHIEDPHSVIGQVAQALSPTGIFYVEVPDVLTCGRRPASDNILGALHHHLYSPAGLALVLQRAGLMVLEQARVIEPSGKISVCAFAARPSLFDRLDQSTP